MDDVALAERLTRDAGLLAARMLAEGLITQHKSSISDVVSAADHAAEAFVVDRLRTHRPDDALVGEEGASAPGDGSGRTWYIDPVDGTYNFLSGLPAWCSALALDAGPSGTLGAVFQPSADEVWLGGDGLVTACNGSAVARLVDRRLADVSVATYLHPTTMGDDSLREPLLHAMQGAATVRMLGSGSVELAAVAAGRLGASLQSDSLPWDWLPGAALVRGAGGVTEVVEVRDHHWHVAGNAQTVAEIVALLRA